MPHKLAEYKVKVLSAGKILIIILFLLSIYSLSDAGEVAREEDAEA